MDSQPSDVMTVVELCGYLQFSEAKIREMLRQGLIPAVLIGRQWRIRKSAIDKWLEAQEQGQKVVPRRRAQEDLAKIMGQESREAQAQVEDDQRLYANRAKRALEKALEYATPSLPKPPKPPRATKKTPSGARKPPP